MTKILSAITKYLMSTKKYLNISSNVLKYSKRPYPKVNKRLLREKTMTLMRYMTTLFTVWIKFNIDLA